MSEHFLAFAQLFLPDEEKESPVYRVKALLKLVIRTQAQGKEFWGPTYHDPKGKHVGGLVHWARSVCFWTTPHVITGLFPTYDLTRGKIGRILQVS
jgi:hypothetical protein